MRQYIIGAIVGLALCIGISLSPASCNRAVGAGNKVQIEQVVQVRVDTIVKLDTLRKTRIKYIDTSKIIVLHDTLDRLIPIDTADNDGNQIIAANQLREALRWKDSLNTCIDMRKVDSVALDTLSKLAKKVDTIKACSITEQAKSFGLGALFGIAIRSFF